MVEQFVHLRLHSEFSLVDGLIRIKPLMSLVAKYEMNAVAVTDNCNVFAAIKVYKAAIALGIKPILGAELLCCDTDNLDHVAPLILLCQNNIGYRNLFCLISKAYQEGQHKGQPSIRYEWISPYAEGLIALSGGCHGAIGQAILTDNHHRASALIKFFSNIFPQRFYLEVQRTGRKDEDLYNKKVVLLAQELNCPLVATNDVRFLYKEDFDAHEARVCIHKGVTLANPKRDRSYSAMQYFRSSKEMYELFKDLPQALANSIHIAKRCTVMLDLNKTFFPNFSIPDQSTAEDYLSKLSSQGLLERLSKKFNETASELTDILPPYEHRLRTELTVINSMGFTGYFLIVADVIQWAIQHDVPVGPGRGSGAGSLVAYALKITDLDPLQHELIFERFLNPERISMPDFDIDFCMDGRDKVIEYVAQKYGRQSVSQIITFGTMAAKAVVRDVGRVLGYPYPFVDKIAKLIPLELHMTLRKALEVNEELKNRCQTEEEVREIIDLSFKLEGIVRNAGKHAGGVVIAPSQLTDFTAIYCEAGSTHLVSQFDKDDVETVGLVKFDFLGLKTLTVIDKALKIINKHLIATHQVPIDITLIPIDDIAAYNLLRTGKTKAIFQVESRGMTELALRLQLDCFDDIIALVALYRPGPLQSGMVDDFINRKHGRTEVNYPHEKLEIILQSTYGVILYQEQVMQIAQVLANYTLGGADILRRAMGKKKPEEMVTQRNIFTQGAMHQGVDATQANYIFDLMEKFSGYGFNKSHAAAYALITYQTAWLKAHFPAAFMAAVLSADMDNTDKIVEYIYECKCMHLKIIPPSVNTSDYQFQVLDNTTIMYGLGAIKGLGINAINYIIAERTMGGKFLNLFNFCERLDLHKINRRTLEALIRSGALDCFTVERSWLLASLEKALSMASKVQQNQQSGQLDLFSSLEHNLSESIYTSAPKWSEQQRLEGEKATLGLYLTGHPANQYCQELKGITTMIANLNPNANSQARICGQIWTLRNIITKRNKYLHIVRLEDASGKLDIVVFSEAYAAYGAQLQVGQMLVVTGIITHDSFSGGIKMVADKLNNIEQIRQQLLRYLLLALSESDQDKLILLKNILKANSGHCKVIIRYKNDAAQGTLILGSEWRVTPSDHLLHALYTLLGQENIFLIY